MRRVQLDKPKPLDYVVMIGGPVLFLVIAWLGIRSLIGPTPEASPVEKLRQGVVRPGMYEGEVLRLLGEPKSVIEAEDGKFSYRYQKSTWDAERQIAIEEDAYVDFSSDSRVSNVSFESRTPPVTGESP